MTHFTIIIPARLGSSRLPEKLLQFIGDKTVLEHSYLAAKQSLARRVVIAADDEKTVSVAKQFADEVVLTRTDHKSGTDRLTECVALLDFPDEEIIVNLQADEPFMPPALVNLCAETLANDAQVPVATLAARLHDAADITNPNAVKVVVNRLGHALYFSRAGIPFNRDGVAVDVSQHYFHHLGIYGYRAAFLKQYSQLPESGLERLEKLEQLRIMDAGEKIAVAIVNEKPPKGIDTLEDLAAAQAHWAMRHSKPSKIQN